ncbi:hypothetical protein VNO77_42015 [Canavalia gladiata]|uniref:Uncharacterized protein n=1 Tax=Canavalia gladiata TaxID=3824 RepID=A0AAN9JZG7_CANGL
MIPLDHWSIHFLDRLTSLSKLFSLTKDDSDIPVASAKIDDGSNLLNGALVLLLSKWLQDYGPIYSLAAGPRNFVVVNDPAIDRHVLKNYGNRVFFRGAERLAEKVQPDVFNGTAVNAQGKFSQLLSVYRHSIILLKNGKRWFWFLLVSREEVSGAQLRDDLYLRSKSSSSMVGAQEEGDRVFQGRHSAYEDIKSLKFLTHDIVVSLRLYPYPQVQTHSEGNVHIPLGHAPRLLNRIRPRQLGLNAGRSKSSQKFSDWAIYDIVGFSDSWLQISPSRHGGHTKGLGQCIHTAFADFSSKGYRGVEE